MSAQPAGTVTFLFTDIEGSTKLLQDLGTEAFRASLEHHRVLLRRAWGEHGGVEVDTAGDGFLVAFVDPASAVAAAAAAQRALAVATWPTNRPLAVRIGIHAGEAAMWDGSYVGLAVNRAARICSASHGGQTLVSQAVFETVQEQRIGGRLRAVGSHRLKDFPEAQPLYQLEVSGVRSDFPPPRTIANTNLPQPAHALLGRDEDLSRIRALLADGEHRLVTIIGTGGAGKTRLALGVGHELVPAFADGTFFVPLAAVTDPGRVPAALAEAMGVRGASGGSLAESLPKLLAGNQMLLVVDNVEHLLGAAPFISDILAVAPEVVVLATSREPLRIAGEVEYHLEPLDDDVGAELFVARMDDASHGFVSGADRRTIAEVVARLDGLPLAIELAAARAKFLGLEGLLRRLEHRFDVLRGGRRDALPRQQTLLATLEWSYELLSEDERRTFADLSIFPGGCTIEAAETICAAGLDTIASLLDKSLLRRREEPNGNVRLWMLQTIREFAALHAIQSPNLGILRRSKLAFFAEFAEQAERELWAEEQTAWLERLDREHDNMLSSLADGFADPETARDAARLAAALVDYWDIRGEYAEAREWYDVAIEHSEALNELERSRLLLARAVIAAREGDRERAFVLAADLSDSFKRLAAEREEARAIEIVVNLVTDQSDSVRLEQAAAATARAAAISESSADALAVAHAVAAQEIYAINIRRDFEQAAALSARLAALYTESGDRRNYGIAVHHQAFAAAILGHYRRAEQLAVQALGIGESLDDRGMRVWSLVSIGEMRLGLHDFEGGSEALSTAVDLAQKLGMVAHVVECVRCAAAIAACTGDEDTAALLAGAADAVLPDEELAFPAELRREILRAAAERQDRYRDGQSLALSAATTAAASLFAARVPTYKGAPVSP
jgi:predicted ATPase/class 3 adenylate cyclase